MKTLLIILLAAAPVLARFAFFTDVKLHTYVSEVTAVSDGTSAGSHIVGPVRNYTRETSTRPFAMAAFGCDVLAIIALGVTLARTRRA